MTMRHEHYPSDLRLLGGKLCIDFVNTIENRVGKAPVEFLTTYGELLEWSSHAGILSDNDIERLLDLAVADHAGAEEMLQRALELRGAIYRTLFDIAHEHDPGSEDLKQIQSTYARGIAGARLARTGEHFSWDWHPTSVRLDQMLWPIALSTIDLLTAGDLRRLKICANPDGCGWLFYDSSKNRSRRWCSMEGCGSQVKMRRQYAKQRAERQLKSRVSVDRP